MDGTTDHSDSDSGESWTLLDRDVVIGEDCLATSEKKSKSIIAESSEKDDDTDGISIISDSEAESPASFVVHSMLNDQSIKEEIPLYNSQDIDIETSINNNRHVETEPLVENNISGDNMRHKIYVHRRNNRLSTVLNIMMLVSVMTAAGVAIGHMWGAKNDCISQTTPSFNKILSDLYKLQAENTHYRNKLRELSLIIEDNLHSECERDSDALLKKEDTVKCRQQKIHEIQKYLKSNAEGKRNKRASISFTQKDDESKLRKYVKVENESKINEVDEQIFDHTLSEKSQQQENYDQMIDAELREETSLPVRKISYADSLKSNNFIRGDTDGKVYKNKEKKSKRYKKLKDSFNVSEISISEEDLVKDGRYSTPKQKLDLKKHDRQKLYKNMKRRNKHEDWDLKEGLLKYYDDLSVKLLNDYNFINSRTNQGDTKYTRIHKKIETYEDKVNPYDYNKKGEMESDGNSNWFDNRAQFRKQARKKQELELLESNPAEWHFKRMNRREQCRAKENSTYKKRGSKPKL